MSNFLPKRPINYDKVPFTINEDAELPEAYLHGVFQESLNTKARRDNDRPYPFDEMEIGDSFIVPAETWEESDVVQRAVSGAACSNSRTWANSYGEVRGYATRKVRTGVSVFRIF